MYVPLRPELPLEVVRPTLKNPDIMVEIGRQRDGLLVPKGLYYPDYMGKDEPLQKAQKFLAEYYNSDGTMKKSCPVCTRYKAERAVKTSLVLGGIILGVILSSYIGYKMTKIKECGT